jgi:hypothetical protein
MTTKIGLIALFALGLVGCKDETVESEDIRTSGIWASFEVTATGNGKASVESELRVGGKSGTVIELTGEDKLVCTAAETSKTLSKSGNAYKATFPVEAGGTLFTFAFHRGDEDEGAPNSYATLPDPFTIAGVTSTQEVSRAAPLTVTWEAGASADPTKWELDGDCLFPTRGKVATDGTLTLSGDDFNPTLTAEEGAKSGDTKKSNCSAKLCIERERKGILDPAFANEEGGRISAIQRRCTSFISVP